MSPLKNTNDLFDAVQDMRQKQSDMRESQIRMEEQLGGFIAGTKEKREWCKAEMCKIDAQQKQLDERITNAEHKTYYLSGLASLVGPILAWLVGKH